VLESVKDLAKEVCDRENCVLWDVEMKGSGRNRILRVTIEGRGHQAGIVDCEKVSKGLNLLLDVKDIIPGGAYQLEVSTPGIEREIREPWQYALCTGRSVDVLLRDPLTTKKGDPLRLKGRLLSTRQEGEEVFCTVDDQDNGALEIPVQTVKKAKTVFEDQKQTKRV
jgi:ribosome maturation factor RimP